MGRVKGEEGTKGPKVRIDTNLNHAMMSSRLSTRRSALSSNDGLKIRFVRRLRHLNPVTPGLKKKKGLRARPSRNPGGVSIFFMLTDLLPGFLSATRIQRERERERKRKGRKPRRWRVLCHWDDKIGTPRSRGYQLWEGLGASLVASVLSADWLLL
jgi:hypothetical protein